MSSSPVGPAIGSDRSVIWFKHQAAARGWRFEAMITRLAVRNSGFSCPDDKITVNLAPADVKKEGPSFDLPIALEVLVASGQLSRDRLGVQVIVGELALEGTVRPVNGVLSIALAAKKWGGRGLLVPSANVREAAVVEGLEVRGLGNLAEALETTRIHSSVGCCRRGRV